MNNYNNNAATTNHVAPLAGLNAHPEPFVPVSQHSSATVHSTTDGVLGLLALHPALDGRVDGLVNDAVASLVDDAATLNGLAVSSCGASVFTAHHIVLKGAAQHLAKGHLHGDRPADARPVAVNYVQLYTMYVSFPIHFV